MKHLIGDPFSEYDSLLFLENNIWNLGSYDTFSYNVRI